METQKNINRTKFHYAWLIMAVCFFLYGGTMGVGYNCGGIFNAAIAQDLGWTISRFTFSTVFLGAASALTLSVVDKIFRKRNLKLVLGLSITVYGLSLAAKCLCSELWQFCLVNAVNGVAAAFLFYVPVPMLINAWFTKRTGFALGLSLLSSGIMGTLMNPVLSAIIESHGWRAASVVNGAVSVAFALPAVLLFARKTPREMGLLPYGEEPTDASGKAGAAAASGTAAPAAAETAEGGDIPAGDAAGGGQSTQKAEKHISVREKKNCFRASFALAMIVLVISLIPQQLAHFAQVNGLSATVGASLVSAGMIGNMFSKATMGSCVDRFGTRKTFTVSFLLVAVGFLIYALMPGASLMILYPAAFLTGITASNNVIVMPFMVGAYSEGSEYLSYMSRVSVATMIGTSFGTYLAGAIYDLTGSYTWEFLLYLAADLIALGLVLRILKAGEKSETK